MTTAADASPPMTPIPPDERLIAEMPFAGGDKVRQALTKCGCRVARDIEALGCTGASHCGLTIEEITELRLGLAGGGVGLPCFVPPNRFCLAHNTIGGLLPDQTAFFPNVTPNISRELTPKEAGRVEFTEAIRRNARSNVGDQMTAAQLALSGYGELPQGAEIVEDGTPVAVSQEVSVVTPIFRCPEHTALNWSCRYCLAQAIVEGDSLTPEFVLHQPEGEEGNAGEALFGLSGPELVDSITQLDAAGAQQIEVYVLAKTLTRKLA